MDTRGGGERRQEPGKGGDKPLTPHTKGPKGLDWWAPPEGKSIKCVRRVPPSGGKRAGPNGPNACSATAKPVRTRAPLGDDRPRESVNSEANDGTVAGVTVPCGPIFHNKEWHSLETRHVG